MKNEICLFRDQVRLIPYGPEHDEQTVQWLNRSELRETFGISRAITLESHRRWLDSSPDVLIWAILDRRRAYLGNTLLHCNWPHCSAYFQIYLGDLDARGRGVGSIALNGVLTYAFSELGLHRIWLHTLPGNTRAERMYESAGFVREGIERDAILRNALFHSQSRWSLLAPEWRARCSSHAS